jgi:hypothetical protein
MFALNAVEAASELKADEQVLLYPTVARVVPKGLELKIHGIVYEPERRQLGLGLIRRLTGLEGALKPAEAAVFNHRCRYFLVDNERGKKFSAVLDEQRLALGTSAANGHFSSRLLWKGHEPFVANRTTNGMMKLMLAIGGTDGRRVPLEVHVLGDTGISVISDVDDTVKISEVLDKKALLRNTFCRPFKPVPGMADIYRNWAASSQARFHYVSASPWQLYLPLSEFMRSNGFPAGTFHLKQFRVKDEGVVELFNSPQRYKPGVIEPMMRDFPKREFVLVGDSGEKDPEIYGAIARQHLGQVRRILIRDVTGEPPNTARYQKAFGGLPPGLWQIFTEPAEIRDSLRQPSEKPKAQ